MEKKNIYKISSSVRRWLENDRFVMDCLLSSSEEEAWLKDLLDKHPEEAAAIKEARTIIRTVRMNNLRRDAEDCNSLWSRIEQSITSKERRKRRIRRLSHVAVAACVLAVCAIGILLHSWRHVPEYTWKAETLLPDSTPVYKEITLIKGDKVLAEIENNARIEYDSVISVQTGGERSLVASSLSEGRVERNELVVPFGRRASLVLPDGTKIWVNSGSTLSFPESFASDKREITVVGEAYIEVVKDASRPFIVKTTHMDVRVLGTKFNVSAYAVDSAQSVVLVEGKVRVNTEGREENATTLKPNQRFLVKSGHTEVDEVNSYDYTSWKDGIFQFRGETLDEIARRLSRYYNRTIICSPKVAGKRTAGKLYLFDDIEEVIKTFSILYGVNYTMDPMYIKIE